MATGEEEMRKATSGEEEDIWDREGGNALSHFTNSVHIEQDDSDDFDLFQDESLSLSLVNIADPAEHTNSSNIGGNIINLSSVRPFDRETNNIGVKEFNNKESAKLVNNTRGSHLDNYNQSNKGSHLDNYNQSNTCHNNQHQYISKNILEKSLDLTTRSGDPPIEGCKSTTRAGGHGTPINNLNIAAKSGCKSHNEETRNLSGEWEERQLGLAGEAIQPLLLSSPLLTFQETVEHLRGLDMSREPSVSSSFSLASLLGSLCAPPQLKCVLEEEQEFVFRLAKCQFDNDDPKDYQLLMTIYKSLTGTSLDCARYGSHWQEIGFQGNDPATDLRGMGLLGLLTVLYLVQEEHALALSLLRLSKHDTQHFPLCVLLINLTRQTVVALRRGYLNRAANRRHALLPVLCELFTALSHQFLVLWRRGKTIRDSGFVLRELEQMTKSSLLCENLISCFKKQTNYSPPGVGKETSDFINVCVEEPGL